MPAGVLSATRYDEGLHVGSSALLGVFVLDNVLVCFAIREGNGWIFRVLHCCAVCLLVVLSYFLLTIDAGTLQLLSIVGRAVYN